jgi:hypothetical protein
MLEMCGVPLRGGFKSHSTWLEFGEKKVKLKLTGSKYEKLVPVTMKTLWQFLTIKMDFKRMSLSSFTFMFYI